jgi:cytochrome o ubiquinol oxidase subunit 2
MQPERWKGRSFKGRGAGRLAGASSLALLLSGCSRVALLDPGGPIAASERSLILVAFGLMLLVVVPVVVMAVWFPRRYRAGDPRGGYDPEWSESARVDAVIWLIPAVIVLVLGVLTWRESHRLDPAVPIASNVRPLEVEVVSLEWKWLFIYPREGVAAVNQLVIPANTPLNFRLTSDSVLTSFFIPRLGSQIYAMAGGQSRLHLMADRPGVYEGHNQQFNGGGFADMHFKVLALTPGEFDAWVRKIRRGQAALDDAQLAMLRQPGASYPVTFYAQVSPDLFERIVNRYRSGNGAPPAPRAGKGEGDGKGEGNGH